jgi:sugar phosphate isomerase/epimerase
MFDGFAPEAVRGNPAARQAWAVEQMKLAAKASRHLGLESSVSFPGALAWPFLYPWPQRPAGLIDTAFVELGKRWTPILDVYEEHGVDVCFEIHPGEDVFDGATFEMFLDKVGGHKHNHQLTRRTSACRTSTMSGSSTSTTSGSRRFTSRTPAPTHRRVYSGFLRLARPGGRFRSLGDGGIDFRSIFAQLSVHNYDSGRCSNKCAIKHRDQEARGGAAFIATPHRRERRPSTTSSTRAPAQRREHAPR